MKHSAFLMLLLSILLIACSTKRINTQATTQVALDDYQNRLADSILQYGLENEALYTLLGKVKPMSSLVTFSFPVANLDSAKRLSGNVLSRNVHGKYLDRMYTIQQAMNRLDIPDLKFIIIPYQSPNKDRRIIQLSVVRISSLDSLLKVKENFYGQFGLVPGSDPNVVVSTIECNDKFERWRGYGYLFGYPDYAVDFYNEASLLMETNNKFVERSFFRIPTYSSKDGNFVYAYPKGHVPTADVDSVLYYKAAHLLNEYKDIRSKYLNADSTLQAYKLLKEYYSK